VPSPAAIRKFRLAANLRREDVASRIGVSFTSVKTWEEGRNEPRLNNIILLAQLFGVNRDELYEDWEDGT
jgi:transcriptional regulator with XRE-family HTH domain